MPTNDTTTKGWQALRLFLKKRGFQIVSAPATYDQLERNALEMVKDIKVHVMQDLYREADNKEYLLQSYRNKHIHLQVPLHALHAIRKEYSDSCLIQRFLNDTIHRVPLRSMGYFYTQ